MRSFVSKLFVIALFALVIYNFIEIRELKSEISGLRADVASLKTASVSNKQDEKVTSRLITDARRHLEKAKDQAVKGNFDSARNELQKSLQILEKAGRDVRTPSVNAYQSIKRKLDDTTKSMEDLWHKLDGGKKTGKEGGTQ